MTFSNLYGFGSHRPNTKMPDLGIGAKRNLGSKIPARLAGLSELPASMSKEGLEKLQTEVGKAEGTAFIVGSYARERLALMQANARTLQAQVQFRTGVMGIERQVAATLSRYGRTALEHEVTVGGVERKMGAYEDAIVNASSMLE